ncbi:hypothetical protein ACH5RR_018499 [Cinchona calisaya]|uniref:VQ domain-containing protein n=1 Tax=Cinchona calisaya TaxID=153742 RepID=A0ABD2ZQ99_9GENT
MNSTTQSSQALLQNRLPLMESGGLPNATEDEERAKFTGKIRLSPENSCTNYGDLDHTDNKTKPNRRRSRASKNTPTILLNANTTNFRALVQQFTGCQSASSFKGPINLHFGGGSREENDLHTADDHQSISLIAYNNFVNKSQPHNQVHDQQLKFDDQERLFSRGSFNTDSSLSASGNLTTYTTNLENIAVEDNNFLADLPGDFSSNGLTDQDFFC